MRTEYFGQLIIGGDVFNIFIIYFWGREFAVIVVTVLIRVQFVRQIIIFMEYTDLSLRGFASPFSCV